MAPTPRFVDRGAFTVVGIARPYKPDTLATIPTQWNELQSQAQRLGGRVGGDAWGVWFNVLKGGGGTFTYLAGVPVGEFAPMHPDFDRVFVAPMHYAVFTHTGPTKELRQTMDAIMKQWLPSSAYVLQTAVKDAPDFLERYSEEFNDTGEGPVEIWLPVKKK